jgi:hypothetical protein
MVLGVCEQHCLPLVSLGFFSALIDFENRDSHLRSEQFRFAG